MTQKNVTDVLSQLTQAGALCSDEPLFHINHQGQWHYRDSPLPNKFARLFLSVLHRIDVEYFLITPVEKVKVLVAEHVLLIIDYSQTANGEVLLRSSIDSEHIIKSLDDFVVTDESVHCTLERAISAKLNRASFYRFAEHYLLKRDER